MITCSHLEFHYHIRVQNFWVHLETQPWPLASGPWLLAPGPALHYSTISTVIASHLASSSCLFTPFSSALSNFKILQVNSPRTFSNHILDFINYPWVVSHHEHLFLLLERQSISNLPQRQSKWKCFPISTQCQPNKVQGHCPLTRRFKECRTATWPPLLPLGPISPNSFPQKSKLQVQKGWSTGRN